MSLIERDRAAAFFADKETGGQVLICSEIGSEGRNFQFVHQLILWDLPANPDLLQQRIGRLDRIGQKHIIRIHVPYLRGSEQELLFRWYDEGLNVFRHNNSAARHVADELADELNALLHERDFGQLDAFIGKTRERSAAIETELHQGRDQLLELNSCRRQIADEYIEALQQFERQSHLWQYMEDVFECYGVDTEFHSNDCFIRTEALLALRRPRLAEELAEELVEQRTQARNRPDPFRADVDHRRRDLGRHFSEGPLGGQQLGGRLFDRWPGFFGADRFFDCRQRALVTADEQYAGDESKTTQKMGQCPVHDYLHLTADIAAG